jgi:FtsP/CotA-like multicopper oxidase with cupredoxin domain
MQPLAQKQMDKFIRNLLVLVVLLSTAIALEDVLVESDSENSDLETNYIVPKDTSGNKILYEQLVTPLNQNGSIYDEEGNLMIWRNGTTVYAILDVDICRYTEHVAFNHRCYNGKFVGPTIHVKQGDTLHICLNNNLGPEASDEAAINDIHFPNHTSLHFHGIHASPSEDNVFNIAGPGESVEYTIVIDEDHYPGTHWYHAHYHGSSAYQIMTGLHGAFIIEPSDPMEFYPEFIKKMREIVVIASNLKMYAWDNGDYRGM